MTKTVHLFCFDNTGYKYNKSLKKNLKNFDIKIWTSDNISEFGNIQNHDLLKFKIIYKYGGLGLSPNIEILKKMSLELINDLFLVSDEDNNIKTDVIWSKRPKNKIIKEIIDSYKKEEDLNKIVQKNKKSILILNSESFYPNSKKYNQLFLTDNTIGIYIEGALSKKDKLKLWLFRTLKSSNYYKLSSLKWSITKRFEWPRYVAKKIKIGKSEEYKKDIIEAISKINEYKSSQYIIFHNPKFIGVTNATKELFENLVPLKDLFRNKDINKIAKAINDNHIEEVYFSAMCYNWHLLMKKIKKINPKIKIKVYWHANHSQVFDKYSWQGNVNIIKNLDRGVIDTFGTCKNSLINFYKKNNFNSKFLDNIVNLDSEVKPNKKKKGEFRIGIYSALGEWRKNMYTQLAVAAFYDKAVVDMIPTNIQAERFANTLGVKIDGLDKTISREELFRRMATNDINIYITFSECAPMVPIESLELGVPCITGNNHHYFRNTELEQYLVVNNETDIEEIKNKIDFCLKNKDKILSLYKDWKKEHIKEVKRLTLDFIEEGK